MKKYLVIILIILLASTVFAKIEKASLNATGYDWLGYTREEKAAFPGLLYAIYGIDKNKNKPVSLIQTTEERVKYVYRIKVRADNSSLELKPGMPADAYILME